MTARLQLSPGVLIATLGSEPQVVTAGMDLLLKKGEKIGQVEIVHTVAPGTAIETALQTLKEILSSDYPASMTVSFFPLTSENRSLADIETPQAGQEAFRVLYRRLWQAKQEKRRVHLLVAGGRKPFAIYGMVAAQLLFDHSDCLWHLYSSGDFLMSKRAHPQVGDDVHLVPIPVLLRSYISPALTNLRKIDDALLAVEHFQKLELESKLAEARSYVYGSLTGAERRAVELLVREGLSNAEIAQKLSLSARTVEQQLRSAFQKAANHWEMESINRSQLVSLLSVFYSFSG